MFIIRNQQMQAIARTMFEAWMTSHLREFFEEEVSGLAPGEVTSRIRTAADQARRYGFVHDCEVCRYIDLTFVFGQSFDTDPDLPWAAEILQDHRFKDPAMRMDVLYAAAQDCVERLEEQQVNAGVSE